MLQHHLLHCFDLRKYSTVHVLQTLKRFCPTCSICDIIAVFDFNILLNWIEIFVYFSPSDKEVDNL